MDIISSIDESSTYGVIAPTSAPTTISTHQSPNITLCIFGSHGGGITEAKSSNRKLTPSHYKGVVPQHNGRWGAQIYEKDQRVWLGSFADEKDAARSYDVAAQRFRGREAYTNLSPLSDSEADKYEFIFLNSHSKSEIVDMLRKHIYYDELEQSRQNIDGNAERIQKEFDFGNRPMSTEVLFEKTMTQSDVGKLNRLVLPKIYAEKHFPFQHNLVLSAQTGIQLNFKDSAGKVWRFRYSYWKSSHSYVITKGWSRFVKEKNLTAGDIVRFHRSISGDEQLYIDWKSQSRKYRSAGNIVSFQNMDSVTRPVQAAMPMVRLFGVNIAVAPEEK